MMDSNKDYFEDTSSVNIVSLSIDDTNSLREKLGLKPLCNDSSDKRGSSSDNPIIINPKEQPLSTDVLRERIYNAKLRRSRENLIKGIDLINISDEELDKIDLEDWVKQSRIHEKVLKRKKIDPVEISSNGSNNDINKDETIYDIDDIDDLLVAHDLKNIDIKPGDELYLSLKDQPILSKKGSLVYEDDVLFNESLEEHEARVKRSKGGKYNPLEDEKELEINSVTDSSRKPMKHDVLPHYDEWSDNNTINKKKMTGFKLNQLKSNRSDIHSDINPITLTSTTGIQRDFYLPHEVPGPFNNSKSKKNAIRKAMEKKKCSFLIPDISPDTSSLELNYIKPHNILDTTNDYIDVDENIEDTLLYKRLAKNKTVEIGDPDRVLDDQDMESSPMASCKLDDMIKNEQLPFDMKVKSEIDKIESTLTINDSIGLIDTFIKTENKSVQISDITEFCGTVETPLEKLETLKSLSFQHSYSKKGIPLTMNNNNKSKESWKLETHSGNESVDIKLENSKTLDEDEEEEEEDDDDRWDGTVPSSFDENSLSEEQKKQINDILSEKTLDSGISSALNYLKTRGELNSNIWRSVRHSKESLQPPTTTKPNEIKLEYKDDYGRLMTPKEAFRYISWVFHGKGPGKKKREKMLKKMELEKKMKNIATNHQNLPTLRALRKQQKAGQAFVILSGSNQPT